MKLIHKITNNHFKSLNFESKLWIIAAIQMLMTAPFTQTADAQSFSEIIQQTAQFQDPGDPEIFLGVYNIQGNVTIEGYDGDEIEITAEKQINALQQADLDRGREEVQLAVEEEAGQVLVYLDAPFINIKKRSQGISYNVNRTRDDYDFRFDITIKVPFHTNIQASTINKGEVTIKNVDTIELIATNVNGNVSLENVAGTTKATTVNGDIRVSYSKSPDRNSEYKTVNGSIEAEYPENLSADIRFNSMHGDLYTDFENIQRINPQVTAEQRNSGSGTTWRINRFSPLRIGDGGPEFNFQVLNGDVYVKRIKS